MVCINLKIEAIYLCNRKEKGAFILILPAVERDTASMLLLLVFFYSCCCFWVSKLCPTLCDPMDCSMPVPCPSLSPRVCLNSCHWVSDAIQPSHPLLPPSPPALNLFPASRFFPMNWLYTSGGQSVGASASVLPVNIQGWFPLGLSGLSSLLSKGLSRIFSSTTIWKH